jgi:hypothetical protein
MGGLRHADARLRVVDATHPDGCDCGRYSIDPWMSTTEVLGYRMESTANLIALLDGQVRPPRSDAAGF